ncbi:hypothetical protein M0638_08145 [Roseomonas sp. NAR14]|uniref:Uncharacterized protein n=1 Tax=Roseomonas acroporae TaxID=2937791 RepID=A0A9X2BTI3_9PROT|nr:hypothetical protein [Roseomonas acroporae]MCK8784347.1 hypothetical protein [Roseomonas acroporae]
MPPAAPLAAFDDRLGWRARMSWALPAGDAPDCPTSRPATRPVRAGVRAARPPVELRLRDCGTPAVFWHCWKERTLSPLGVMDA